MIKIDVVSECTLWSKKIKKNNTFFNSILKFFPKKYKFIGKKIDLTILLSNNKNIKKLNKDFRSKNKPTDVLSFPFEKRFNPKKSNYLGDIVISYEFINKPKNISILEFKQKVVKIFIHGFLHLLGHDHIKLKDFKKMSKEEDFEKKFDLDRLDYLVISKTDYKLLTNIDITDKNFLRFFDLPLSFKKLLELINIRLIKLKFNHQSKVIIKGYELNLNSKFFSKDNLNLKLTEKEIKIILYLNDKKIKHNVADLQKNIWSYSVDMETHTVETHIYRLRKKISDLFKDEKFILSHKDGYFID